MKNKPGYTKDVQAKIVITLAIMKQLSECANNIVKEFPGEVEKGVMFNAVIGLLGEICLNGHEHNQENLDTLDKAMTDLQNIITAAETLLVDKSDDKHEKSRRTG